MAFKKNKNTTPFIQPKKTGFTFVFIGDTADSRGNIIQSIDKIKKEHLADCSFFLISENTTEPEKTPSNNPKLTILLPQESEIIFSEGDGNQIIVWHEAEMLRGLINFNEFFRQSITPPGKNEFYELEWKDQPFNISPGLIIDPTTLRYILKNIEVTGRNFKRDIPFYLRNLHLTNTQKITINTDCPFTPSKKILFKPALSDYFKRFYNWNVVTPLKEGFRTIPEFRFTSEPPVSRFIFLITSILVFLILPIISFNAGISGDEEKHHMHAQKVYNYFATAGRDTSALHDPQLKLNYYGQSFDLMAYLVVKVLNTDKIYEVRHVMNGAIGALAIITAGILARYLAGSMAGILTMIFMFFSPRFLGHAMNNPMDIPFALGYIFTILQIIRFLDRLPRFSYSTASLIVVGIAFTISIRIGGLLLIPYLFMFSGIYLLVQRWPWKLFSKKWFRFAGKGLELLLIISIAGYFLSLIPWPYGLKNPIKNPLESLKMMSNIDVSLRVFFNGSIHWSDKLPWFYIPKFILISVPIIILTGFVLSIPLITLWRRINKPVWLFVLLFSTIFPIAYVIYIESNVYGGWRHLIFIYPTMVVLAVCSFRILYDRFDNKIFRIVLGVIIGSSLISPAAHIFRNYPNQYIYFNRLVGGVNKAYKNFETDYYLTSLKTGTDWIKKNVLDKQEVAPSSPIRIISNAPALIMQYYFKDYKDIVESPYTRYYDRGIHDWDYAVFFCNYIDPFQIRKGIWPPKNTIYTVNIDDVAVCAVVKRENKDDFEGSSKLSRGIAERNTLLINEALEQLERAAEYDPNNEAAWINLATGYIILQQYDMARQKLNRLLEIYPQYDRALSTIGYSYLSEGEYLRDMVKIDMAITYFNEAIKVNYKHSTSYYNLALAYYMKKDYQTALNKLQSAIDFNPGYRDPYALAATIFEETGHHQEAARWREYLQSL